MKKLLVLVIAAVFMLCWAASASAAEFKTSGYFLFGAGSTNDLQFTEDGAIDSDDPNAGSSIDHSNVDPGFQATREMGLKFEFIANENLKAVAGFYLGENGNTEGGYFGATDALVGGEEAGDVGLEVDELYLDFNWPGTEINFRLGSQLIVLPDTIAGSQIMLEVPPAVVMNAPVTNFMDMSLGWVRLGTNVRDDKVRNDENHDAHVDEEADLFFLSLPIEMQGMKLNPYAAYARIGENSPKESPYNYLKGIWTDYDYIISQATGGISPAGATNSFDDTIEAMYAGARADLNMFDPLIIKGSVNYGYMDVGDLNNWSNDEDDVTISGFHIDGAIAYQMDYMTPEIFGFWGQGPDDDDEDLDMFPALIPGVKYTTTYLDGSLWNDSRFEGRGKYHVMGMWAVGFKLKDIKLMPKLTNEIQVMYAEGTSDGDLYELPNDDMLNEDEDLIEVNLNSKYQIYENLAAVSELGYIFFDEDSDYDDRYGDEEDAYKVTFGLKYSF